jgi:hypothetical protein
MPIYKVKRAGVEDSTAWEVTCSYSELTAMCEEYGLVQELSTPNFVSSTGNQINKTSDGWKDRLSTIKSQAGRNNSIKL